MTITIPTWLLWTLGVIAALPMLAVFAYFAVLGWMMRDVLFSKRR